MSAGTVRVTPSWLDLREPADAAARAPDLVDMIRPLLTGEGAIRVADLGCGTGSMMRWLAPRLAGPQHWVMYDRDADLLAFARAATPKAADGSVVTIETRERDITRLRPDDFIGTSLITASALLDMFTADELERFVDACCAACCPVLITISVVGRVDLSPSDPLDASIADAFNAHQRRSAGDRTLLGPDAVDAAAAAFERRGVDVTLQPSPWVLAADQSALLSEWLRGWVEAACEQEPRLNVAAADYTRRRLAQTATGALEASVHHLDLLAVPR